MGNLINPRPGTRYVTVDLDFWYDEKSKSIHLTAKKKDIEDFHVEFTDVPGSKRRHDKTYEKLKRVLQKYGKWPEGVE